MRSARHDRAYSPDRSNTVHLVCPGKNWGKVLDYYYQREYLQVIQIEDMPNQGSHKFSSAHSPDQKIYE
jgi:hypothetical protein